MTLFTSIRSPLLVLRQLHDDFGLNSLNEYDWLATLAPSTFRYILNHTTCMPETIATTQLFLPFQGLSLRQRWQLLLTSS